MVMRATSAAPGAGASGAHDPTVSGGAHRADGHWGSCPRSVPAGRASCNAVSTEPGRRRNAAPEPWTPRYMKVPPHTAQGPDPRIGALLVLLGGAVDSEVHAAHAARRVTHGGGLLGLVGHDGLGCEEERRDRGGVLQRRPG